MSEFNNAPTTSSASAASALNHSKTLCFLIQYYEFAEKVDPPIEFTQATFSIDGLFHPDDKNRARFCLGYTTNPTRSAETTECLKSLGLGVHIFQNNENKYCMCNNSPQPVYIIWKNDPGQTRLGPGEFRYLYDMHVLEEAKKRGLPKKVSKAFVDHSIKVSFGREFAKLNNGETIAPCWVELNILNLLNVN